SPGMPRSVTLNEVTQLTFGGLYGVVSLSTIGWTDSGVGHHKVVDHTFHGVIYFIFGWISLLGIISSHRSFWEFIQALADNANAFVHFLHPHIIACEIISFQAGRDFEFYFIISGIRCNFAHIVSITRAA